MRIQFFRSAADPAQAEEMPPAFQVDHTVGRLAIIWREYLIEVVTDCLVPGLGEAATALLGGHAIAFLV
jgi:hypothetical protein